MSRSVPEGWQTLSLSEGINILSGYPFDSSSFTDDSSKTGLIRIRDLVRQKVATYFDDDFDDNYLIRKGDVLIGMDGDFNIVKWDSAPSLLNQRICKVTVAGEIFDLAYLYQDLQKDLLEINNQTGSTTVKHLSVKDIRGIHKSYPPLPEQKKIASILTSVDEVIENTQKQIDKLQDLKKATMNELLTKGIGHTEFKDSELGRIPKSWEVKTLSAVAEDKGIQTGPFGSQLHAHEYTPDGVPVVMPKNMRPPYLDISDIARIPEARAVDLTKHRVKQGDILFSRRGDIGRFALIDEKSIGWICGTGCLRARVDERIVLSYFLAQYLTKDEPVDWLNLNAVGLTMLNLSTSILEDLPIVVPPIEEQRVIVDTLKAIDELLVVRKRYLLQARALKKSLMQDLLTGNVRVSVD